MWWCDNDTGNGIPDFTMRRAHCSNKLGGSCGSVCSISCSNAHASAVSLRSDFNAEISAGMVFSGLCEMLSVIMSFRLASSRGRCDSWLWLRMRMIRLGRLPMPLGSEVSLLWLKLTALSLLSDVMVSGMVSSWFLDALKMRRFFSLPMALGKLIIWLSDLMRCTRGVNAKAFACVSVLTSLIW